MCRAAGQETVELWSAPLSESSCAVRRCISWVSLPAGLPGKNNSDGWNPETGLIPCLVRVLKCVNFFYMKNQILEVAGFELYIDV